jgi:hypothetical protein
MRFLMLYQPAMNMAASGPPNAEHMAEMGKLIEEQMKAEVLLETGPLLPTAMGVSVRRDGGEVTVTDGALKEIQKPIVGYALVQVGSKEELIAMAKRFLEVAGDGDSVAIPIMDMPA